MNGHTIPAYTAIITKFPIHTKIENILSNFRLENII
jgi:hypothetical protein